MDWLLTPIRALFDWLVAVMSSLPGVRAVLGTVLVLFLPGYAWTLVFFRGRQINIIERIALSMGLSIAVVTLSILALNLVAGVTINGFNGVLIILTVTAVPVAVYFIRRWWDRRSGGEGEGVE